MLARLVRQRDTGAEAMGVLSVAGRSWFTIERPWKDNQNDISCVPTGLYNVAQTWSPRFRTMMYLLDAVPGRFGVRIHPANLAGQLHGCIALGQKRGTIEGRPAVLVSRPAVRDFENFMGRKPFKLEVVNGF
jgi:hypothetical protein